MNRHQTRTLDRELRHIAAQAKRNLQALRKAAEAEQGRGRRKLVTAELIAIPELLLDPVLGRHAQATLVAVYGAAQGLGPTLAECFGCCQPWSDARGPVRFLRVDLTRPDATMLSMLCRGCCGQGMAELQRLVVAGVSRDFFGGGPVDLTTFAPGGRA